MVVLNRENFEWNNSSASQLNQYFREKTTAVDFIEEFNRVTNYHPHKDYRILRRDACKEVESSPMSEVM